MSRKLSGTLDTNILLRLILNDVPDHNKKAREIIERPGTWHVSVLSIVEAVFVLEGKGFSRYEVKQNVDVICALPNISVNRDIIQPAIELYALHPSLSFVDACLAFEAETAQPLWTFDKK